MRTLGSIAEYFTLHPILASLKYLAAAIVGSAPFTVISLFTGNFDITVPVNGLFLLVLIGVYSAVRFGVYNRINSIKSLADRAFVLIGLLEAVYFLGMLVIAWDATHPQMTSGALTMFSLMGHFAAIIVMLPALVILATVTLVSYARRSSHAY